MRQYNIVAPVALQHTQEVTCTPSWYVQDSEYPPAVATYQPLINGEEAFEAVHSAIAQATKTIDIICWGFQPSMYFIRDGVAPSIGKLLMAKAKAGVEVRILGWEMPFNSAGAEARLTCPAKAHCASRIGRCKAPPTSNTRKTDGGLPSVLSLTIKRPSRSR